LRLAAHLLQWPRVYSVALHSLHSSVATQACNFTLLFVGQIISSLGDQAYGLELPWTALVATGDPRQMAAVLAAEALLRVLFLLLGGALADRLGPRLVVLVADKTPRAWLDHLMQSTTTLVCVIGTSIRLPESADQLRRVQWVDYRTRTYDQLRSMA